jgi:hypothetical protein
VLRVGHRAAKQRQAPCGFALYQRGQSLSHESRGFLDVGQLARLLQQSVV